MATCFPIRTRRRPTRSTDSSATTRHRQLRARDRRPMNRRESSNSESTVAQVCSPARKEGAQVRYIGNGGDVIVGEPGQGAEHGCEHVEVETGVEVGEVSGFRTAE